MEKDQERPPQQIITDVHIWNELATTGIHPAPRHVHNCYMRQDKMIVFGGYTDGSTYLKDIYEYDFERKRWRNIKALKGGQNIVGKHSAAMVIHNDKMYVFAGVKHLAVKTNELIEFDFEKFTWREVEQKGDIPAERWGHTAVMYNGEMIVFGGFGSSFMNDIHAYNFETETWRRIFANGRQPKPRHLHTAVVYKDTMIICGGYAGSITLADLWEYDFKDNSWTHLDEYNEATNRRGHSAVVYKNKMIVFGGAADSQSVNTVYQWHLERKKWKKIEVYGPEPTVRHFHTAVLHEDSMYIFGGIFKSSNMNDIHEFPLKRKGISDKPTGAFVDLSKLLADKKYCDVTFILEDGTTFQAHKNILVCRSEHFKAMLEGGLRESGQNMIRVPGVREPVFKAIMQFIYTDTVTVTDDIAVDLFITSDKFLLPKLKCLVEDALLRAIDSENLPSLMELATLYSAPTLKLACEMFTKGKQRKKERKNNRPLE